MENDEKSPVIDRLIQFMNYTGLTSSQFADKADIPRPSLSQMLHGRNKSVNNQVLAKLNFAFPHLNILWLLFGRGNMLQESNFEISERQNRTKTDPTDVQQADNKTSSILYNNESPNLFTIGNQINQSEKQSDSPTLPFENSPNDPKKISSIIVLYTDGSFETFRRQG